MTTKAEKKYMNSVAELGCVVCRRMGYEGTPSELHHPRRKAEGWGRSKNIYVLPLCPEHHRGNTGVHGLGTKVFPKHWGFTEDDLADDVAKLLNNPTD
jgi:hypothetical protein